jgi:hypothetical protein
MGRGVAMQDSVVGGRAILMAIEQPARFVAKPSRARNFRDFNMYSIVAWYSTTGSFGAPKCRL